MFSRRIFFSLVFTSLTYTGITLPVHSTIIKNLELKSISIKIEKNEIQMKKNNLAYAQICSCKSYYGIPHSCYYSPVSDYDYSCYAKCIREANQ